MTVSDIPANYVSAALNAGCAVVSASTPALSGTYPIDPDSQQKLLGTVVYVGSTGKFPAGQAAWVVRDVHGAAHSFPSTALFVAFVNAERLDFDLR